MKGGGISGTLGRFAAALVLVTFLASAALYAEFNAGYYAPEKTGAIRQTMTMKSDSGATYDAGAYPLFPATLPAGTGREEVEAFCNTCHSTRYITMQPPLPAETWAAEVNKMIKTYGASFPEDSTKRITEYLQENFSEGKRKH